MRYKWNIKNNLALKQRNINFTTDGAIKLSDPKFILQVDGDYTSKFSIHNKDMETSFEVLINKAFDELFDKLNENHPGHHLTFVINPLERVNRIIGANPKVVENDYFISPNGVVICMHYKNTTQHEFTFNIYLHHD